MSKIFSIERTIRFSHCDPAGIVYFVNFFDFISAVVEDWFARAIEHSFHELHMVRRWGFPIADTRCQFLRPCHLGDTLAIELAVARLGRSSIEFVVRGSVAGEEKLRGRHTVVMVSLDDMRPMPIPADLRARMEPYVLDDPAAWDVPAPGSRGGSRVSISSTRTGRPRSS